MRASNPFLLRPAPGLDGVADGVAGPVVQIHAAIEQPPLTGVEAGDLVPAGVLVHPRDQEPLGVALGEQIDGVADPLRAARHGDDAVGPGLGRLLEPVEAVDEAEEAEKADDQERGGAPETEGEAASQEGAPHRRLGGCGSRPAPADGFRGVHGARRYPTLRSRGHPRRM